MMPRVTSERSRGFGIQLSPMILVTSDDEGDDDGGIGSDETQSVALDLIVFESVSDASPDIPITEFVDAVSAVTPSSPSMFVSSSSSISTLSLFVGFPFIPFNAFGLKRWKL